MSFYVQLYALRNNIHFLLALIVYLHITTDGCIIQESSSDTNACNLVAKVLDLTLMSWFTVVPRTTLLV